MQQLRVWGDGLLMPAMFPRQSELCPPFVGVLGFAIVDCRNAATSYKAELTTVYNTSPSTLLKNNLTLPYMCNTHLRLRHKRFQAHLA